MKMIFDPKRTDDLKPLCLEWVGKEVTVLSWHENVSMRDNYPDDDRVGYIEEFCADIPESELKYASPPDCVYDTDGDGNCHRCIREGGCAAVGGPFGYTDGWRPT